MKSVTLLTKMHDLGVTPSRGRPRVSNDNPYSESLFRTLKYCPQWPSDGFASLEAAREWVRDFMAWYNEEHRHSRIRFVTPNEGTGAKIKRCWRNGMRCIRPPERDIPAGGAEQRETGRLSVR